MTILKKIGVFVAWIFLSALLALATAYALAFLLRSDRDTAETMRDFVRMAVNVLFVAFAWLLYRPYRKTKARLLKPPEKTLLEAQRS